MSTAQTFRAWRLATYYALIGYGLGSHNVVALAFGVGAAVPCAYVILRDWINYDDNAR